MQWGPMKREGASTDWVAPAFHPWARSLEAQIHVSVPWDWERHTVGRDALVVSPPDRGVTVGIVSRASWRRLRAVVSTLSRHLTSCRTIRRTPVRQHGFEGVILEGVGVRDGLAVEWFVAYVGDARCGAVVYGVGRRSQYDRHFEDLRAIVRSVRPDEEEAFVDTVRMAR